MATEIRPVPGHVHTWMFAAWIWAVPVVVIISELADYLEVEP